MLAIRLFEYTMKERLAHKPIFLKVSTSIITAFVFFKVIVRRIKILFLWHSQCGLVKKVSFFNLIIFVSEINWESLCWVAPALKAICQSSVLKENNNKKESFQPFDSPQWGFFIIIFSINSMKKRPDQSGNSSNECHLEHVVDAVFFDLCR